MGAGAGCTIKIKNCEVVDIGEINLQGATLDTQKWSASLIIPCSIKLSGTVNVSSYYDTTGDIEEVAMTVDSVVLYLGFGENYNKDILTADAVSRFESQFGGNIEDITEEILPVLTVSDIDPEFIRSELDYGNYYEGSGNFGGGWVRSTFDGAFEITDVNSSNGYNDITDYTGSIDEAFVIEYIDVARYGDNLEYTTFYNGEPIDIYGDLDEAIAALKREIEANLAGTDPYECYVVSSYYFLTNGSVGNYEYESDFDSSTVEYRATDDYSDELFDTIDELDAENDTGIDEDYDV